MDRPSFASSSSPAISLPSPTTSTSGFSFSIRKQSSQPTKPGVSPVSVKSLSGAGFPDFDDDAEAKRVRVIALADKYKPRREGVESERDTLKRDVDILPDESYTVSPEDFGAAMLRGMGWKDGEAINSKGMVQPIRYLPREHRLGLGAEPAPPSGSDKPKGVGSRMKPPPERLVAPVSPGKPGLVRSYIGLDEKAVKRRKLEHLSRICVTTGRHTGLYGYISRWSDEPDGIIYIALELNGEVIQVPKSHVRLTDIDDQKPGYEPEKTFEVISDESPEQIDDSDDGMKAPTHKRPSYTPTSSSGGKPTNGKISPSEQRKPSSSSNGPTHSSHDRRRSRSRSPEPPKSKASPLVPPFTWVMPNLYVRVVAKGKHYTKKGYVFDVVDPAHCTLHMDDHSVLEDVTEAMLETMVPKHSGEEVMILHGKHKGCIARIRSRDSDKEMCLLQIDNQILNFSYEHICQFVHR